RALYGSYERFFMVLIEHFDGDFPLWLAPEQVRILPVSDGTLGYAHRVKNALEDAGLRVEVEDRDWTVGRKIRAGHDDRLPYMVIVGDDEREAGTVSVRDRFENQRGDVDLDAFVDHLVEERDEKRTEPDFVDAA
ncbi:MAG: His/Gly/Thr/Pro-type tRNA ligase C-terminal domain-containing protein, partial [Halanaeroarchaeum sp.]